MKTRLLHQGVLALWVLVSCGRAASHHELDAEVPNAGGDGGDGTAGSGPAEAGANPTGGSALASGGTETVGPGGDGPLDLGGMASAGAGPTLMLPPGCVARTPTESANLCSLKVDCDASPSVRTYCHVLDSGQWECQCANQDSIYWLKDAAGLEACALAARLCSDSALEVGEEENCEQTNDVSDQDSCTLDAACANPVDLGPDAEAQAWRMRFGSARCTSTGAEGSFQCRCSNGGATKDFGLLADSGELACAPLMDFCLSDTEPVFDGAHECSLGYFDSSSDGCQRFAGCGPTMPLTAHVRLSQGKQVFASCVPGAGGDSECSCSDQDSAFSFRLPGAPDDASCEASILNCNPDAVIERTAPPICEPQHLSTSGANDCDVSLSCVQDATVDGRAIVAEGNLRAVCARTTAGSAWQCSCASGPDTAKFELGAPNANAAQACNQAPAGCLERLGLHIGPYSEGVDPPDPLP